MKLKEIVGYLRERNKLSLRNVRTGREIWHVFVSRSSLVFAFIALLIVLLVVVLATVAYTPVLDLIPGYPGSRSREALIANIMKLDSLSAEVGRWEEYHGRLAKILDGQVLATSGADAERRQGVKGTVSARVGLDSVLRAEMTTEGSPYRLQEGDEDRSRAEVKFEMLPPVKGVITRPFSPKNGMFGVEIAPAPNQVVLAVLDGAVILDSWNPETGNTLVVQHGGNMISVYKQVARALKSPGEHVRAGEPVAVTDRLIDNKIPHLTFELWYNGTPVDPENYIVF